MIQFFSTQLPFHNGYLKLPSLPVPQNHVLFPVTHPCRQWNHYERNTPSLPPPNHTFTCISTHHLLLPYLPSLLPPSQEAYVINSLLSLQPLLYWLSPSRKPSLNLTSPLPVSSSFPVTAKLLITVSIHWICSHYPVIPHPHDSTEQLSIHISNSIFLALFNAFDGGPFDRGPLPILVLFCPLASLSLFPTHLHQPITPYLTLNCYIF